MAIDQSILFRALDNQLNIISDEINEILNTDNYTAPKGQRIVLLSTRAVKLLAARKKLRDSGTPLTGNRAGDIELKPILRNALESYRGKIESQKVGTDKDSKIGDVTSQIAEFR